MTSISDRNKFQQKLWKAKSSQSYFSHCLFQHICQLPYRLVPPSTEEFQAQNTLVVGIFLLVVIFVICDEIDRCLVISKLDSYIQT